MNRFIKSRKYARVQVRLTIEDHNALMRAAITDDKTLSEVVRHLIKLHSPTNREAGNAAVQPASGL